MNSIFDVTCYFVSVPSLAQPQSKKQSLASRLSEKFQASLNSDREEDDDFQPDKKRIRTEKHMVIIITFC